jgi:glutamate dehydrogenase (NADP+)
MSKFVDEVFENLKQKDPHQNEFLQAAEEVLESLKPFLEREPHYEEVLPRLVEPERIIQFRVPWTDDQGKIQCNRGYRVQFNSAIGPTRAACASTRASTSRILKFLAFEQIFKNSLCQLPMGGGKGGSDFDPRARATRRSCASASRS